MHPPVKQVLRAVLYALFGVSSEEQRRQDFQQSHLLPYVVTGILATVLFVLALVALVLLVLR